MFDAYQCFLRSYRKRSGLTQGELAYLAGLSSDTSVSKIEMLHRDPTLKTVLTCQLLFRATGEKLFPGTYAKVDYHLRQRALALLQSLRSKLKRDPDNVCLRDKAAMLDAFLEEREGTPASSK